MKKALFCLVFLGLTAPLASIAKDRAVDLTGSWKEFRRISRTKAPVDYTDTTYYDFLIGNEYTVQRKNSFMYRGTYKLTSGTLDMGMRQYNVVEMSNNRMLLRDDAGTYEFVRYNKMPVREDNTAAANAERGYKPNMSREPVRPMDLVGNWEVYKRTSSTEMPEIDYTRLLRELDIKVAGGSVSGLVYSAKDMDGAPSWKITRYDGGMLYCTGAKGDRILKVVRGSDGELIIQEEPVTYFFKHFK